MKRIYVAGKYDDENVIKVLGNIRRGIEAAGRLMMAGFAVYCPFLDFQFALTGDLPIPSKQQFQRQSMAWVEVCDAVLVLPGWETSGGTARELSRASLLSIPIFYDEDSLYRKMGGGL